VEKEETPFVLGDDDKKADVKDETNGDEEGKPLELPISKEQMELQKKAKEYLEAKSGTTSDDGQANSEEIKTEVAEGETKKKGRKRKRTKEFDDDSTEESSDDEAEDDVPPGMDKKSEIENKENDNGLKENDAETTNELKEELKEEKINTEKNETNGQEDEIGKEKDPTCQDTTESNPQDQKIEEMDGMKPRPLHKVTSIFLRNLSPTITKQEVEAMCRRYPGFLRAAIADPSPERRWFRRGWVTFERDIKIKDICFNLNNIRLR